MARSKNSFVNLNYTNPWNIYPSPNYQPFVAAVLDRSGTSISAIVPQDYNTNPCLIQHFWFDDNMMNAVMSVIENNPLRVAWIGDCSDMAMKYHFEKADEEGRTLTYGGTFISNVDEFTPYFDATSRIVTWQSKPAWSHIIVPAKDGSNKRITARRLVVDEPLYYGRSDITKGNPYLVNITKKEYVDLIDFYEEHCIKDHKGEYWCIHPLPLVTAVSNGYRKGDYFHNTGQEYIGQWAFDEIFTTATNPKRLLLCRDFKEIKLDFSKNLDAPTDV